MKIGLQVVLQTINRRSCTITEKALVGAFSVQGVPKKMSFSGKTAITTFKLIQNAKVGGVLEKMIRILCSQYTLIDPHSHSLGHESPWTWHIKPRVQNYFYFTFYQHMEQVLLSLQVMKMQRDIKGLHIVSSEFCPFLEGGLATLCFIFSVISSSILKISVPMW